MLLLSPLGGVLASPCFFGLWQSRHTEYSLVSGLKTKHRTQNCPPSSRFKDLDKTSFLSFTLLTVTWSPSLEQHVLRLLRADFEVRPKDASSGIHLREINEYFSFSESSLIFHFFCMFGLIIKLRHAELENRSLCELIVLRVALTLFFYFFGSIF